jgi:hypothetical protein
MYFIAPRTTSAALEIRGEIRSRPVKDADFHRPGSMILFLKAPIEKRTSTGSALRLIDTARTPQEPRQTKFLPHWYHQIELNKKEFMGIFLPFSHHITVL